MLCNRGETRNLLTMALELRVILTFLWPIGLMSVMPVKLEENILRISMCQCQWSILRLECSAIIIRGSLYSMEKNVINCSLLWDNSLLLGVAFKLELVSAIVVT